MGARNTCTTPSVGGGGGGGGSGIIKRDDNDNDYDDAGDDEDVVEELVNEAICRGLLQVDEILEGNLKRTDNFGAAYLRSGGAAANEITSP